MTIWLNQYAAALEMNRSERTIRRWAQRGLLDMRLASTAGIHALRTKFVTNGISKDGMEIQYSLESLCRARAYVVENQCRNLPRIRDALDSNQPETIPEAYMRLSAELGRPPTIDELSEALS